VKFVLAALLATAAACAFPTPVERTGSVAAPPNDTVQVWESPRTVSLNGPWKYHTADLLQAEAYRSTVDDSDWPTMPVPSNWTLHGVEHAGAVWFRRHFDVNEAAGRRTVLVFEGVDYTADVWLNDHYLGFHEGYFERFTFPIGELVRPDGPNLLVVRVNSPYEQREGWSLKKRQIKGVFGHHDARPGNAWSDRGQERGTGGIWGDVSLKLSGDVSLDAIRVRPSALSPSGQPLRDGGTGRVTGAVAVTNALASPVAAQLRIVVEPHNFSGGARSTSVIELNRTLPPGSTVVPFDIDVNDARLWWMWEHGRPNLYRVDATLTTTPGSTPESGRTVFGLRSIAVEASTGTWRLNGRRVFLRGTNYIATQWLSEMSAERYQEDLTLMRRAGINAVRVHAHIEGEALYQKADEAGILVWQDFPLQWGYEDSPTFIAEAVRQGVRMIDQLEHHPSIVAWSGHNEPPWDATWMKDKYADYSPTQNVALDDALYEAMVARDASRYVHKASLTTEHPWLGWYSGSWTDYAKPTRQALITEFGAQALPALDSLRRFIPESALWPKQDAGWDIWAYHDFQPQETFKNAGVARGSTPTELIANTQRYQAQLVQFAAEAYRRQKHAPVAAIFQFMFNECWPSANWGVVDYWRAPKPGFDALARAYQPVLPSIEWVPGRRTVAQGIAANVWVVNDLHTAFPNARLEWSLRTPTQVVASANVALDVAADSAAAVLRVEQRPAAGAYELLVELKAADGRRLGWNRQDFALEKE
jgi:beta-mannosidase